MAANLFGQTLLTEYRFNTTVSNTSNLEPFSYVPNFTLDRAGNANSAYQLTNNPSTSSYAGPSGSSARTVSLWYNTNSNAGSPVIFSYGNSTQYQRFGIYLGATGNPVFWGFNYDYDFGGTYAVNTWHHLVLMFNGTNVTLYMNGTLVGTVSRPLLNTAAASQFSLLTTGFASKTVLYDDLKVYSGVLTASQVNDLNAANILQPITNTTHNFCSSTNPTVANLTTSMGTNIQWYANQFGGTALISTTPLSSGTYWCSQSVAGLESFRSSTLVTVSVDNPTVPTFNQIAPICSGSTLVLPSTSTNGISGSWSPAVNNTATTTYTFSSNACSPTATMTVTVNSVPTAPTASASVSYGLGQSATALTATGTNLLWYTQAVGGVGNSTAPVPNTSVPGVTSYWVSQTNASGCESQRAQITVTVGNTNSLHFDGTNDFIQVSSAGQYPTGNSSYTVEAWLAPGSGSYRGVLSWGTNTYNQFTAISISGIIVSVNWGGGANLDAYYTFPTDQWNHIATTWDGVTRRIFINGVLASNDIPVAHNCAINTPLILGNNGGFVTYQGGMDEVRIFNYSKTAAQIQATMYCEIPGSTPGLLNYFRFNQGVAGANNTAITTATNEVATGYTGGLSGFGLTGNTSNWVSGSPMGTQTVPNFGLATPLNICSGTSYALPTTSLNGITGTWSPAFNNTASATYTFTPAAGQCATTAGQTVQIISSPMASTFTQVAPICVGGTLSALPTLSMQGNNGTWSPALNNMATTTYTFTPNPGVCANTATMTITVNPGTTPTFTQVAPVCAGTSFTLPTTSNNSFTGTWSPAMNTAATTTYTFTPTAGQCASTTTMTVTVNPATTPTFAQVAPICSGSSATLPTTSTNGFSGTWSPVFNNTATTTYTFTPTAGQCASTTTMTIVVDAPTAPTFTAVSAICSGETLSALPTTSTNGISGTWSPALNNMATTIYTFTPSAGQCASTATLTIVVNQPIQPNFGQVAAICTGENLSPLATTSNNGISGTWSPAPNNMATTTYTFTPTAGQCATSTTMTITVNAPTTPLFTQIAPICVGGQIVGLYNVSNNNIFGYWSPVENNQATTTYTFTPDIGQCATTTTMTVVVNTTPTTPTFTQIQAICAGSQLTLPTVSTEGVVGTWSPAANNQATTAYTFTPAGGQCATTTTMTVSVSPLPATPTGNTTQTFNSASAMVSDLAVSPSNVIWYATLVDATNGTNPLAPTTVLIDGSSYFAVNTDLGCSSTPFEVIVTILVGVEAMNDLLDFTLYPNPTHGVVKVENVPLGSTVFISDATGRVIAQEKSSSENVTFDLTKRESGVYFVSITTEEGKTATKKLLVKP